MSLLAKSCMEQFFNSLQTVCTWKAGTVSLKEAIKRWEETMQIPGLTFTCHLDFLSACKLGRELVTVLGRFQSLKHVRHQRHYRIIEHKH